MLIKHWRKIGIRIFAFLDDFFGGPHNFRNTEVVADRVRTDLFKEAEK